MGVMAFAGRRLQPAIEAQKGELAKAAKHANAAITAIDLVKVFNGFDHEVWQYCSIIKNSMRFYLIQAHCNAVQLGYVNLWIVSLFVVGFWYGIVLVNDGLSPGGVLTTFYATLTVFQAVEALMPQWLVLSKGMAAGHALDNLGSPKQPYGGYKLGQRAMLYKPQQCFGNVELQHVGFTSHLAPLLASSSHFYRRSALRTQRIQQTSLLMGCLLCLQRAS
jgi:ATP-binding cassette, subfamily B (MDR/TAP), member 1